MKITVELLTDWYKSEKGYTARAVFKDQDTCQRIFGCVFSRSSPTVSHSFECRLLSYGKREFNGKTYMTFFGVI